MKESNDTLTFALILITTISVVVAWDYRTKMLSYQAENANLKAQLQTIKQQYSFNQKP